MTSRDSDQRYLAATAWLAPGQGAQGDVVAVMAAASDASLQLLAFHVRHSPIRLFLLLSPYVQNFLPEPYFRVPKLSIRYFLLIRTATE